MVKWSPGHLRRTPYFVVPQNPNPSGPNQVLAGPYQLEMRRGTEYGATVTGTGPEIVVFQQFDTNDRMVESLLRLGDQNTEREQGQLRIEANTVRFASGYGILVDAGSRDATGVPHPGGIRNLPTLNAGRLVPSLTVRNNVIAESGVGGILFSGDPNAAGTPLAVVPFGQLVNNTVYGGVTPRGTGIRVEQNASPTILNNIVANNADGILVDATSTSSVIGANLFKSNTNDGVTGSNAILLGATAPLFVDAARGNFYLAAGSQAVDSSLNRLDDRPEMVAVTSPLGIPPAPVVAPEQDRFGQLRIDDPLQAPPPGLGSNIFKDRGAVERADFEGPFAVLVLPKDNDALIDLDPAPATVLVEDLVVSEFAIQINDVGIGLDDRSVVSRNVTLILNGQVLTAGTDYVFRYDPIGDVIRLSVRKDVAPRRNVYEIVLANDPTNGIRDLAANGLRTNQTSGQTRFTIRTAGLNDAPVAVVDHYVVDEDAVLTANDRDGSTPTPNDDGVLRNDTDADFDVLKARLVDDVTNGFLALNTDGSFTYTPNANFNGSDSFTYEVSDDGGTANGGDDTGNTVTVTITVNSVNDAPVAVPDAYSVDEDGVLAVPAAGVLANDSDPKDSPANVLSARLVDDVKNGVLALNANGSFVYTPNANFNGSDSFTYEVSDDGGTANGGDDTGNTVTVTITVNSVNDAPVAVADAYSVFDDDLLTVPAAGVLANDSDPNDDPANVLSARLVDDVTHGVLTLSADGSFAYTPIPRFSGLDSFTYEISDDGGTALGGDNTGNTVTVTITVIPVNDAPVAVPDAYSVDEDGVLTVPAAGVLANDSDPYDDPANVLSARLVDDVTNGVLALNADGSFTYTPNANFNGIDSFTYEISDDGGTANGGDDTGNTVTVTITVNSVNDAPVAVPDAYSVDEDGVLTVPAAGVLANDSDPNDDPANVLSARLVDDVTHGVLALNADGSFTYAPNANFNGSDSFTYEISDDGGTAFGGDDTGNTVTVTITVNPVNDAPVAVPDAYSVDEDGVLTVPAAGVLANDSDPNDDPANVLSARLVDDVTNGVLALNADGSFTYTPNANFNGFGLVHLRDLGRRRHGVGRRRHGEHGGGDDHGELSE